ncbi:Cytochrome P450 6a20 [Carabus blaptoides fortunei]
MSPSFPFGNVGPLLMKTDTFGHSFRHIYEYFKARNQAVGGYYFVLKPELIIVDVELIKCILTKDFTNFMDRGTYIDEQNDPLSAHLFALPGVKWKALRAKLTPTFTSGKMKMMFPTLVACSGQMEELLENLSRHAEPIDMKDILARFTIDVIGSCAFGIDCNSMTDPDNEFRKFGIASFNIKGFDAVRQILVIIFPKLMQFLRYPGISPKISTFFMNVVKSTVSYREKNNIQRNDFLQLLLNIKNQEHKERGETESTDTNARLTLDQIAAQCFVFFLAGFDTSSTTMTFSLFEMASNQEIQDKVRDELVTVLKKYNGQLTYEAIMELHYLDKVICGLRFGLMQTKVGLAVILKNFKCSVNGKTKLPIVMSPESFMTTPEGGIWLDLHKITS